MRRCIDLARLGGVNVAPNPMVGAIIVYDNQIIGEGYHVFFGGFHAEVNAINSVKNKELLKESTLYVSLEPCSHHGKTPPCADRIIDLGPEGGKNGGDLLFNGTPEEFIQIENNSTAKYLRQKLK